MSNKTPAINEISPLSKLRMQEFWISARLCCESLATLVSERTQRDKNNKI